MEVLFSPESQDNGFTLLVGKREANGSFIDPTPYNITVVKD
jgi:hypothetical protein